MIMSFEILRASNLMERDKWIKYWESLKPEYQDVCFRPEYILAYEVEKRGEALCCVIKENDQLWLYPFLKNKISESIRLTGSDFYDIESPYGYSGPVVNDTRDSTHFLKRCWTHFSDWCRNNKIVTEFCRFHPLISNELLAASEMEIILNRQTVAFDLSEYPNDFYNSSFFLNHRGMINRAIREGLNFEFIPYSQNFERFLSHYTNTQILLKASSETFFGIEYFKKLAQLSPEYITIGCVKKGDEILCAVIVLNGVEFAHLHLMAYYSSANVKGMVNFLYHHIALEFGKKGLRFLQVGGGKTSSEDDPLFLFKKRLTPVRHLFYIGKRVHDIQCYESLKQNYQIENPDQYALKKHLLQFYRES